jgi:hypothetical protein
VLGIGRFLEFGEGFRLEFLAVPKANFRVRDAFNWRVRAIYVGRSALDIRRKEFALLPMTVFISLK